MNQKLAINRAKNFIFECINPLEVNLTSSGVHPVRVTEVDTS